MELSKLRNERLELNRRLDELKEISSAKDNMIWALIGLLLGLFASSRISILNGTLNFILSLLGLGLLLLIMIFVTGKIIDLLFKKREKKNEEEISTIIKKINFINLSEIVISDRIMVLILHSEQSQM
ncbi:hypothetical protein GH810_04725 [Acetobacterium paludosum]|uniref:Uncharacterized protein n=1 Tax=Acetobacterium paludosum TaxID=52693 RepID=A0A923HRX7_9FIRM|nr:hypothetical protein [Acetobacterium paludosum]MBC3887609.1 hypothetical protein [Acetobacterium paludosum]